VMAVDRKLPEQDDQNESVPLGQLFTSQTPNLSDRAGLPHVGWVVGDCRSFQVNSYCVVA
jgi:hypothetical protein